MHSSASASSTKKGTTTDLPSINLPSINLLDGFNGYPTTDSESNNMNSFNGYPTTDPASINMDSPNGYPTMDPETLFGFPSLFNEHEVESLHSTTFRGLLRLGPASLQTPQTQPNPMKVGSIRSSRAKESAPDPTKLSKPVKVDGRKTKARKALKDIVLDSTDSDTLTRTH